MRQNLPYHKKFDFKEFMPDWNTLVKKLAIFLKPNYVGYLFVLIK